MPVLVIEDDEDIREMLQWALEDVGVDVETASDGREAVNWIEQRRPSLVLLDLGLPFVNGVGVADRLRDLYGSTVPVIIISADAHLREKAEAAGLRSYFQKPFDIIKLVQTVSGYLSPCPV